METAGDYHATERLKWDSDNNAVALEPGVVFTYDRNTQTNAARRNAGVEVIPIVGAELGRGQSEEHLSRKLGSADGWHQSNLEP